MIFLKNIINLSFEENIIINIYKTQSQIISIFSIIKLEIYGKDLTISPNMYN